MTPVALSFPLLCINFLNQTASSISEGAHRRCCEEHQRLQRRRRRRHRDGQHARRRLRRSGRHRAPLHGYLGKIRTFCISSYLGNIFEWKQSKEPTRIEKFLSHPLS